MDDRGDVDSCSGFCPAPLRPLINVKLHQCLCVGYSGYVKGPLSQLASFCHGGGVGASTGSLLIIFRVDAFAYRMID